MKKFFSKRGIDVIKCKSYTEVLELYEGDTGSIS